MFLFYIFFELIIIYFIYSIRSRWPKRRPIRAAVTVNTRTVKSVKHHPKNTAKKKRKERGVAIDREVKI